MPFHSQTPDETYWGGLDGKKAWNLNPTLYAEGATLSEKGGTISGRAARNLMENLNSKVTSNQAAGDQAPSVSDHKESKLERQ